MNNKGFNRRFVLSIAWVIVGIALIVLCKSGKLAPDTWIGVGGGLIGVGIMQIIQKLKYLNNPEYKEKVDVEISDERNSFIRMKAWSWAGYIFVIGSAILALGFMVTGNKTVSTVLGLCTCGQLIVYVVAYYIVKKKY